MLVRLTILLGLMLIIPSADAAINMQYPFSFKTFINNPPQRNTFIQDTQEHQRPFTTNPCGGTGQEFMTNSLTQYFLHRWQAQYRELPPEFVRRYREHFELGKEVVSVRVFSSPHQPLVATLTSRLFENYLDKEKTQRLVSVLCIVPVHETLLVRQHTPDELQEILENSASNI